MAFLLKMIGLGDKDEAEKVYPTEGDPSAKLQLVSFPPVREALLSGTPFGGKVEVAMRLAGLEYEAYNGSVTDPRVAPKKKFPVLWHGGQAVPDSSAIIDYLFNTYPEQMAVLTPPDDKSCAPPAPAPSKHTPLQKAIAHAAQRMLEEHSYFAIMSMLWLQDDVWSEYSVRIFKDVPPLIRGAVAGFVRSSVARDLYGQGMARHSREEIKGRLAKDLDACSALLEASGAFLSGSTPCPADCFLFSLVDSALGAVKGMSHVPAYSEQFKARPALVAFHTRLQEQLFSSDAPSPWKGTWPPKAGQ